MSKNKHIAVERTMDNANPIGHYTMTLRDRNENIIQQGTYPIHSAIFQYWQILYNTIRSQGGTVYTRITGSGNGSMSHLVMRGAGTGSSNDARGIVVGTSSAAVQLGDRGLGGFIQNGTGSNELTYSATVIGYDSATGKITLTQTFTNNALSTEPTVNEIGIAVQDTQREIDCILIVRDVPGSSYAMLLNSTLTVSYELEFPFGCQNHAMLFAKHQIARNTQNLELYDANGSLITQSSYSINDGVFGFVGATGDATRGIILGTNNDSEAFNTFVLGSQIVHGTNSGDLFYYESTISSYEFNNTLNNAAFYLSRVYKNKSGSTVTVREVGLSSNLAMGATNNTYLFDRRVLGSPVAVDPNDTLTITWAYRYTFT